MLLTFSIGNVWGETFSQTYEYGLNGWSLTNYDDKSNYYLVPKENASSVALFEGIFSAKTITSNVVVTINSATYGSGSNPMSSTFAVYSDADCKTLMTTKQEGKLPTDKTYVTVTYTIAKNDAAALTNDLAIKITKPGKQIRLKSVQIKFDYTNNSSSTDQTLSVNPTEIDFGTVEQGSKVEAQSVTATLTNITYAIASLSGTNADAFEITEGEELTTTGTISVQPKATTLITIGNYEAALDVEADGVDKISIPVKLSVTAPFAGKKLMFDLTENNLKLPTAKTTKAGNYTYSLDGENYIFYASNAQSTTDGGGGIYYSTKYVMIYQKNSLGLPALAGYKLVKAEVTNSSTCSPQVNVSITTDGRVPVVGGDAQTFSTVSTTYTYSLSGTTANTMYYLTVANNKNCQVTGLTLYYEAVEPTKSTITLNVNPEDAAIVGATYGNPATEIESGTTLVAEDAIVKLSYVAEDNYRFRKWKVKDANNTDITLTKMEGEEDYTFTMPASAVTATANFVQLFTIAKDAVIGGTLTISAASAAEGDEVTITATPASKYKDPVVTVYKDGDETTTYTVTNGKFTMPGNAVRVKVTFTEITCTQLATPVVNIGETTYKAVTISWDAVDHADKYIVTLQDDNYANVGEPVETIELTHTFTSLTANTNYIYIVKAVSNDADTYCESEEASDVIFTTDYPAATLTLSENGNEVSFDGTYKLNDKVTLPTSIDNLCVGKQLVGWSEVEIETSSSTEPTSQYYKAGTQYTLKAATQKLYAVYATENVGAPTWNRVETLESITTGQYVIISNSKYLPNTASTSSAPEVKDAPTITNNTIVSVEDVMIWNLTDAGNSNFYIKNNTGNYLYAIKDNNGIRVGSTSDTWTFEVNSTAPAFAMKESTNSRYCAVYNDADWRSYTSRDHQNYKDGGRLYLYKYTDGAVSYSEFSTTCTASIAAPVFDVENGKIFGGEDLITITAVDGSTVYYTINGDDPTTTSTIYDADNGIALTDNGEYVIKAIAVKGEAQSEVVTATYGVLKPFNSLQELIDCKYAEEKNVTISFDKIEITNKTNNGLTLAIQKEGKNIQIYNSKPVSELDKNVIVGGKLYALEATGKWTRFENKGNFVCWELTPSDWSNFAYYAPEHITSIEISGDVTEKSYSAGQQLKSDGLTVTGIYSDNSSENSHIKTITEEELTWTLPTLTEGQTEAKVSVSYIEPVLGNTITSEEYTITGLSVSAPRILDHIEIAAESTHKTNFFVGSPFTREGLKVLAYYSVSGVITGDPVDVTGACSYPDPDMTTEGKQTITITYTENEVSKTTAYDINLKYMNLTDLVTSTEVKDKDYVYVKFKDVMITNLYKSSKGDYMGIYLDVKKDGKDIEIYSYTKIPDKWNVEVYGTVSGTLENVQWTYYKNGDVWELTPSDWSGINYTAPVIEDLTISGTATTLTYTEGATFDKTGLKVEATIAGVQQDVTEFVTWTFDPTTLAVGTTSVTAKATYKEHEATTTIYVTVEPLPTPEGDPVVIAFEYSGSYYALKTDLSVYTFPEGAGVVAGKMVNITEANRASITWYRANVEGGVTFQRKSDGMYLTAISSDTKLSVSKEACVWKLQNGYYTVSTTSEVRALLYQAGNVKKIRNYKIGSANTENYSGHAMYLSEYIDGEIAAVRDLNGNIGTLCLAKKVIAFEGAKFYSIYSKDADASAQVKNVTFEEITETLEAGYACIFEPEAGATQIRVVYTGDEVSAPLTGNGLVGIFTNVDDLRTYTESKGVDYANVFVVQNNRIRKAGEGLTSVPNRAYIDMSKVGCNVPQKAGRRYIVLGKENTGTTTSMDEVQTDATPLGTYDVLGRKVGETSAAGLYIINGKKVLIVK